KVLEKGPLGQRRGRGARERSLSAPQQSSREHGISRTGMDELCAVAQVAQRTAYQHFSGKDELVAASPPPHDPDRMPRAVDRTDDSSPPSRRRHPAPTNPRACVHTSRRPWNCTPLNPPRPSTHGTTREPLPSDSLKPPAKPAPPIRNNSANNWRCSWMEPRSA